MMDDIAEQQNVAQEISDAISNPVAFRMNLSDSPLENHLANLLSLLFQQRTSTRTNWNESWRNWNRSSWTRSSWTSVRPQTPCPKCPQRICPNGQRKRRRRKVKNRLDPLLNQNYQIPLFQPSPIRLGATIRTSRICWPGPNKTIRTHSFAISFYVEVKRGRRTLKDVNSYKNVINNVTRNKRRKSRLIGYLINYRKYIKLCL